MGSDRKTKKSLCLVGVFAIFLTSLIICNNNVSANDPTGGGGSGGEGTTTNCPGFIDGYQRLCNYDDTGFGDGSGGGGASWHIYETSGNGAYAGPVIEGSGAGIVDGTVTLNNIKATCTKAAGFDWYIAYGWEGSRKAGFYNRLTGPTHRKDKNVDGQDNLITYGRTQYNNYGALDYDNLSKAIQKGRVNNVRLTKEAANALYYNKTSDYNKDIPDEEGFFCVDSNRFDEFKGASRVSEGTAAYNNVANDKKISTGLVQTNKTVVQIIKCNSAGGCSAKISHYLMRENGRGGTEYSISRTTNSSHVSTKLSGNSGKESFSGIGKTDSARVFSNNFTNMKPGEYVCETMRFSTNARGGVANTTACFYVQGTAGSSINLDVKNTTSGGDWANSVYAKPEDKIALKGEYTPAYQYARNLIVDKTKIGTEYKNNSATIGSVFNRYVDPDWNNAFSISLNNQSAIFNTVNVWGTSGNSSKYDKIMNEAYSIGINDVGRKIDAVAATNTNGIATSPKQITFSVNQRVITASVDKNAISDSVSIIVPYNYVNTTSIDTSSDAVVYAGETASIKIDVTVGKRQNNLTKGNYATVVPNGKWKLEVCDERGTWCQETGESSGKLNENGKLDGDNISRNVAVNIPDWSAGTKVCFRSAVYPANSGADGNYTNANGSNTWQYSNERVCFTVAKKPNFQVWGGNIYSAEPIETSVAEKTNVANYTNYNINNENGSKSYVFGSWGELGVIATAKVKGLASGAGTGYYDSGIGVDYSAVGARPGGSEETIVSYCNRATLSFANVHCERGNAYTGDIMTDSAVGTVEGDKSDILNNMVAENAIINASGVIDLSAEDENKKTEEGFYSYYGGNDKLELAGAEISHGKKIIVYSGGDIIINGDLKHFENGQYSSLNDTSKLVIYGKNIKINCAVSRVDAVLIADGEVNTCVDDSGNTPDVNSKLRSYQLRINGAIIASKAKMNRTYGAGTGYDSITPAEIINFDPTLYLWGMRKSRITDSGKISTISIKELSPRY